ncbi:MAG: SPOR domain-containing protein [Gammaproteobacteria bacterium]|nr:SPOR domain-containing protein [Gammaproteobacteria bacterium]
MDRALKQRLLGAVILAALLVILVPEWLDGSGHRARYPKNIEIPPAPVFQPLAKFKPEQNKIEPPPSISEAVVEAAPAPQTNSRQQQKPTVKSKSSIHAWALQVGSFKDETNALVLRDKLRANGYPAYVEALKSSSKIPYRVRIGPELDRERVNKLKQTILEKEKIQGMVVKHP